MDDILAADNTATACALARLIQEHKGGNTTVLDLRRLNLWTDFFVIATVTSNTHLQGLERHIKEFTQQNDVEILRISKNASNDEWRLIDMGAIVVHLMTTKARSFYELERLWSTAIVIPV